MESAQQSAPQGSAPDSEIAGLYAQILDSGARLAGTNGTLRPMPVEPGEFLREILIDLKNGSALTILEDETKLTTFEAARMLSVSRQYLVRLLDSGQIPFHMVGTHRRMHAKDVLHYKAMRDADRRKILDDILRAEIEEGLYDLVPIDALVKK